MQFFAAMDIWKIYVFSIIGSLLFSIISGYVCYIGESSSGNHNKLKWALSSLDPCLCTSLKMTGTHGSTLVTDDIVAIRKMFHVTCKIPASWVYIDEWSTCSVTCGGGGIQNRTQSCLNSDNTTAEGCAGNAQIQTQECSMEPCPSWVYIDEWSTCSVTCGGGGIQNRTQSCLNSDNTTSERCVGNAQTKTQECSMEPCHCSYTNYSTIAGNETGLQVPWLPIQLPILRFNVTNMGAIRFTVMGDTLPMLTGFVGVDTQVTYQEEICVCENNPVSLSCEPYGGNISVAYYLWGRRVHGQILCLYKNNPAHPANLISANCYTSVASDLARVKEICDGLTTCSIPSPVSLFGDPCVGTFKYTRVTYSCIDEEGIISEPMSISTVPGPGAELYLHDINGVATKQVTSLSAGTISASQYRALYLMVNSTGFAVGFDGNAPFISIRDTIDILSIKSVNFVGLGKCSCEDDPSCSTDVIASEWSVCHVVG